MLSIVNLAQLNFVVFSHSGVVTSKLFSSVNRISLSVFNCFCRNVSIIIILPIVLQVKFRVLK